MYQLFLRGQFCEYESLVDQNNEDNEPLGDDRHSNHASSENSIDQIGNQSSMIYDEESPVEYLERNLFSVLFPALEDTLLQAHNADALQMQKCRFNGLDCLAEILWNRNPRRAGTLPTWISVFEIEPFRDYLRLHPRPFYPKSWLWSREEAALRIQKCVRGWLIRKRTDVQEMRQFWREVARG